MSVKARVRIDDDNALKCLKDMERMKLLTILGEPFRVMGGRDQGKEDWYWVTSPVFVDQGAWVGPESYIGPVALFLTTENKNGEELVTLTYELAE